MYPKNVFPYHETAFPISFEETYFLSDYRHSFKRDKHYVLNTVIHPDLLPFQKEKGYAKKTNVSLK